MADAVQVEIPNRALFKASEVCDLMKVQPYVLRSWEAEFPTLGVAKAAGGPRIYRRTDVEQVARIKHLLLVEGLTLAGARRRLEVESAPVANDADEPILEELIGQNARERLTAIKQGLQSILEILAGQGGSEFRLSPPAVSGVRAASPDRRNADTRRSESRKAEPPARRAASARRKRPS